MSIVPNFNLCQKWGQFYAFWLKISKKNQKNAKIWTLIGSTRLNAGVSDHFLGLSKRYLWNFTFWFILQSKTYQNGELTNFEENSNLALIYPLCWPIRSLDFEIEISREPTIWFFCILAASYIPMTMAGTPPELGVVAFLWKQIWGGSEHLYLWWGWTVGVQVYFLGDGQGKSSCRWYQGVVRKIVWNLGWKKNWPPRKYKTLYFISRV